MKLLIIKWLALYPLSLLVSVVFRLLAPLVAIPVVRELRADTMKRFNEQKLSWPRDYLLPCFKWFATHDNAADEWWYGMYGDGFWLKLVREWTQEDYDGSWFIRYFCRVAWLWRNSGYGFSQSVLGIDASNTMVNDRPWHGFEQIRWYRLSDLKVLVAFQLKGKLWLTTTRYLDINIGWKAHKSFTRLMYAGRIFALRKVKNE